VPTLFGSGLQTNEEMVSATVDAASEIVAVRVVPLSVAVRTAD
jgi:hypothetical protein